MRESRILKSRPGYLMLEVFDTVLQQKISVRATPYECAVIEGNAPFSLNQDEKRKYRAAARRTLDDIL